MKMVSVVIPTYNYAAYLEKAIKSVLEQTYSNYEIIIIDDGSLDNTKEIVQKYVGIKYIYQNNKGVSNARNKGIKEAKGEYIAFLDADDKWLPDKLKLSVENLVNNKLDWICTGRYSINKNGETIIKGINKESGIYNLETGVIEHLEIGLFNIDYGLPYPSTVLVHKSCFNRVGYFDEGIKIGEDYDLWMRFQEAGLVGGYLNIPLIIYNKHENSLSRKDYKKNINENIRVVKKHAKIMGRNRIFNSKPYSEYWLSIAELYYYKRNVIKVLEYLLLSMIYYPQLVIIMIIRKLIKRK